MRKRLACVCTHESRDCGAAALATVSLHYGSHASVSNLRDWLETDIQGVDLVTLGNVARSRLGFDASCGKAKPNTLDEIPLPAIVHFNDTPEGHFAVIYRVAKNKVLIADPAEGLMYLSRQEFMERWSGHLLLLAPSTDFRRLTSENPPLKELIKLTLGEKKTLCQSILLTALATGSGFATALCVQLVLDRVIPHGDLSWWYICAISGCLVVLFRSGASWLRQLVLARAGSEIELSTGLKYVQHVLSLPISYFDKRTAGDVVSRISDVTQVRMAVVSTMLSVCVDLMFLLFAGGALLWYSRPLTLLVVGFLSIVVAIVSLTSRPLTRQQRKIRLHSTQLMGHIIEAVANIRVIKMFTAEQLTWRQVERPYRWAQEAVRERLRLSAVVSSVGQMLTGICSVAVLLWGARLAMVHTISVGQLVFFFSIVGVFIGSVDHLPASVAFMQEALIALERLSDVATRIPERVLEDGKLRLTGLRGQIECRDLQFWHRRGYPVVSNLNLKISAGENVAIVGETGSGKSTLACLIAGLYSPNGGEIVVDGINLSLVDKLSLRRHICVVFQDPGLLRGTIRENISLGNPNASFEDIQEAAHLAAAHKFIVCLPKTYDYNVGVGGTALSSGQRQRIALARAFLRNPSVLILDEATSNLDSETELDVLKAVQHSRKGRTTVVITHRLTTALCSDRICVLDHGSFIETGEHHALIRNRGKYYAMWQALKEQPGNAQNMYEHLRT